MRRQMILGNRLWALGRESKFENLEKLCVESGDSIKA